MTDTPGDSAEARSGGDATVFVAGRNAFGQPIDSLTREERRAFAVGNNFFNDNWVTAPASTEGRDGLGPLFNAQSCSSCHEFDGRGAPPLSADDPERGLLLRFSVVGADGTSAPDPVYGGQLQDRAINGVPAEGRIVIERTEVDGTYADGTPYTLLAPTYTDRRPGVRPAGRRASWSRRGSRRRCSVSGCSKPSPTTRCSRSPIPTTPTVTASRDA